MSKTHKQENACGFVASSNPRIQMPVVLQKIDE
jgi:hypothetical protein